MLARKSHEGVVEAASGGVTVARSIAWATHGESRPEDIALACTHFPDHWRDSWSVFVASSGFEVLSAASLVDQGIAAPREPDTVEYPTPAQICATVTRIAQDRPSADAIVVTGSGARTLAITEELRALSGKRVIAADTGLYRMIAEKLEIDPPLTL